MKTYYAGSGKTCCRDIWEFNQAEKTGTTKKQWGKTSFSQKLFLPNEERSGMCNFLQEYKRL